MMPKGVEHRATVFSINLIRLFRLAPQVGFQQRNIVVLLSDRRQETCDDLLAALCGEEYSWEPVFHNSVPNTYGSIACGGIRLVSCAMKLTLTALAVETVLAGMTRLGRASSNQ